MFRQMIAADPKNADALNSLGYMFAERGQTPRRSGRAGPARACDRAGQRRVSRQPRLGLLQAESIRPGRDAAARGGEAAADGVGHSGPPWRSPEQARPLSGSDRRVADGARRRRRLDLPLRASTTRSNRRARSLAEKSRLVLAILLSHDRSARRAATPRVALPGGPGTPAPDLRAGVCRARARHARACERCRPSSACRDARPDNACAGAIHAGLVPGALRLEGVAPFGARSSFSWPTARAARCCSLRDRRVVAGRARRKTF